MPGPHVDKIYQDALNKLNYEPMTPEQFRNATPDQQKEDARLKKPEIGKEVFTEIENSALTPAEKQEVYQRLVKTGVQQELDSATNPATLLRGNSSVTHFMSAYMNTYAKDYMESIWQDTMDETSKVKVPQSLQGKQITQIGSPIDGVPPQDVQQLEGAYVQIAKRMMDSSEANLSKLTPEAREFMKAALEPTQGNSEAMNMASASTLLLRGATAMTSSRGAVFRGDQDHHLVGALVVNSSVVVQSYANGINKPHTEKLSSGKPQDPLADLLRTQENLQRTKDAYTALSKGSQAIESYCQQRKEGLIKPEMDRIAKLEAKLDGLKHPTLGDRFKAFFQGGIEKVRQKAIDEIDALKMQAMRKVDPEGFAQLQKQNKASVRQLEDNMSEHVDSAIKYLRAKGTVKELDKDMAVMEGVGKSGIGPEFTPEQRQEMLERRDRLVDVMDANKSGHDQFMQHKGESDKLEQNMSVREKLGVPGKAPDKPAPKQGVGQGL